MQWVHYLKFKGTKMKNYILVVVAALMIQGCTKPEKTTRLLQSQGFTDIQITGYRMFICSQQDTVSTGFKAKSINNENVSGSVCGGLILKGLTIRYD